jgi:hypothetical protein
VSHLEVTVHSSEKVGHIPDGAWGGGVFEGLGGTVFDSGSGMEAILINQQRPRGGRVKAGELAEWALADAVNAARVASRYFGLLEAPRVAVTQQSQWFFGQSWPSLVFLPYLSFLDGTQRQNLGLGGAQSFVDKVGYHEMAHQWWGHLVGWKSYRDQWIAEGFAEFTAALTLQHAMGWEAYDRFWQAARSQIADSPVRGVMPAYEAGPIVQGYRLETARSPGAYAALVYSKGGYVLHMLRMAMWDPKAPDPDAAFIALMHDFVSKHKGGLATTEDFAAAVGRHVVPALNATGDGRIDWFFDQWVYGHEVPTLSSTLTVEKAGKDRYRIVGEVVFGGVSPGFRAMVPLYLDFGEGNLVRIGGLPFVGPGTRPVNLELDLPKKPKGALVNAHGEVLVRRE